MIARWSRRVSLVCLAVVAAVLVGCSEIGIPIDTPTPLSGIRGVVLLGPTCPVGGEPGGNEPVPCVTPYAANLVILDSESAVVARVSSGADGAFQVNLPAGEYVVTPATGADTYPIAQPVSVVVSTGQYAEVEINYDTGIR
ncbi:MAG: hypothetical protein WD830_10475 [Chloroflexota bacterium]